mmetsp:Transcript_85927/g.154756  ORF Transcript_85927/g.154756 Transcript_85927/m.154756 type:complete len:329 (-) Transcript_85927:486-1472(-)
MEERHQLSHEHHCRLSWPLQMPATWSCCLHLLFAPAAGFHSSIPHPVPPARVSPLLPLSPPLFFGAPRVPPPRRSLLHRAATHPSQSQAGRPRWASPTQRQQDQQRPEQSPGKTSQSAAVPEKPFARYWSMSHHRRSRTARPGSSAAALQVAQLDDLTWAALKLSLSPMRPSHWPSLQLPSPLRASASGMTWQARSCDQPGKTRAPCLAQLPKPGAEAWREQIVLEAVLAQVVEVPLAVAAFLAERRPEMTLRPRRKHLDQMARLAVHPHQLEHCPAEARLSVERSGAAWKNLSSSDFHCYHCCLSWSHGSAFEFFGRACGNLPSWPN